MRNKPAPMALLFRICVYPSEHEKGLYTAHCLELDLIGEDKTFEGAIELLLEAIETQVSIHQRENSQLFFPAPDFVWQRYNQARIAKRKIPEELTDRIFARANRRLGYSLESGVNKRIENIVATKQVLDECLAANK